MSVHAFTVDGFCQNFAISRATLYRLWAEKCGPEFHYVRGRRLISFNAAMSWQRKLEETQASAA